MISCRLMEKIGIGNTESKKINKNMILLMMSGIIFFIFVLFYQGYGVFCHLSG